MAYRHYTQTNKTTVLPYWVLVCRESTASFTTTYVDTVIVPALSELQCHVFVTMGKTQTQRNRFLLR
jgi:hypothetical protein